MRDLYEDLGLDSSASESQIKSAYRKLAKQYHPDRPSGDAEKFKKISEAHDVLSDSQKRAQYDQMRRYGGGHPFGAGGHPGGGVDFDFSDMGDMGDIFSSIFGQMGGGGATHRQPRSRKGRDTLVNVEIPFNTAILGGHVSVDNAEGQRLDVTIPPGIVNGSRLRLKGQGSPGIHGGPRGDLHVEVKVSPHPVYRRENRNIVSPLEIFYLDLLLGTTAEVKTLHGKVELKVPPGLNAGDRLRVKGYGVRGGGPSGDHYVVIKPVFPKELSPEERTHIEALKKLRGGD